MTAMPELLARLAIRRPSLRSTDSEKLVERLFCSLKHSAVLQPTSTSSRETSSPPSCSSQHDYGSELMSPRLA